MNILISGGTGLVGKALSKNLEQSGHNVRILSRRKSKNLYQWDLSKKTIDPNAFTNLDVIVHLSGENVAQRWTKETKEKIINSRVQSANLLLDYAKKYAPNLQSFVSASGVNFYGTITQKKTFTEEDFAAQDFLGQVCQSWEQAADQFKEINARVVKLRTGIVLAKNGGALRKMIPPAKMFLGGKLGSGKQIMPWIHIQDLCRMYKMAIENAAFKGAYNAVAPTVTTNKEFTQELNKALNRPAWAPPVPAFALKLLYGQMANILLEGSPISAQKIINQGFEFNFVNLDKALREILL